MVPYLVAMAVILPILLFYKKEEASYRLFLLFFVFAFINTFLFVLPEMFEQFGIIGGKWNWSSKIYTILGSIIFYFLFRKNFAENDFVRLRQKEGSFKFTLTATVLLVTFYTAYSYFFASPSAINFENLGFHLTMPGIDEELTYRGIGLGLLVTALKDKVRIGKLNLGHPAIWVTAVLFGLVHVLRFSGVIHMDWGYFGLTFGTGLALGWMTLKSRSILMPIVVHNLLNFSYALTRMLK